jgi:hypothetical protein
MRQESRLTREPLPLQKRLDLADTTLNLNRLPDGINAGGAIIELA